jgi:mono/diheme cytochrome c family protein
MKRIGRFAVGLLGILAIALVSLAAYSEIQWDRTYEAPYPAMHASSDPAVIERGRYLAYGPAECAACHTPVSLHARLDAGEEVPLVGGHEWSLPLGVVRSPNITPDPETGIGSYTDAEIARAIRHGVKRNGRAMLPLMEFQNLAEEDLVAIVSFLRSQEPVASEVPATKLNFIGRAVMATLIRPIGPSGTPPRTAPVEAPTVERGAYLANSVAGCAGCHSQRSSLDGSYVGARFSGGSPMPADGDPTMLLVPPNLTPDPETGHIHDWSEDQFVARFRQGKIRQGSHMPWAQYGRMSDEDLRAIYVYLRSLEPVRFETGPLVRPAT